MQGRRVVEALPIAGLTVLGFLFQVRPQLWSLTCWILAGIIVLVQFAVNLGYVRRLYTLLRLALFGLIALVLVISSLRAGLNVRDRLFRSSLVKYRKATDWFDASSGPQRLATISLPTEFSDLSKGALGEKTEDGAVSVVFVVGGVFPVRHIGYIYRSTDRIDDWPEGKSFSPKFRHVAPFWFGF